MAFVIQKLNDAVIRRKPCSIRDEKLAGRGIMGNLFPQKKFYIRRNESDGQVEFRCEQALP